MRTKKKTICIDMDGVLARYERHAYKGDDPVFNKVGGHYFKDLEPDKIMTGVMKRLGYYFNHVMTPPKTESNIDLYVISKLPLGHESYLEAYHDKSEWLDEHCKDTPYRFIAAFSRKENHIKSIYQKDKLDISDILIDDFNENLISWQNQGGTAIKYINGINSVDSWKGLTIIPKTNLIENPTERDIEEDIKVIVGFLISLIENC